MVDFKDICIEVQGFVIQVQIIQVQFVVIYELVFVQLFVQFQVFVSCVEDQSLVMLGMLVCVGENIDVCYFNEQEEVCECFKVSVDCLIQQVSLQVKVEKELLKMFGGVLVVGVVIGLVLGC